MDCARRDSRVYRLPSFLVDAQEHADAATMLFLKKRKFFSNTD